MKYIEFDVQNMSITKSSKDKASLISGAVNYFGLHFNFDEEFMAIPGLKAVEFIKKNNKDRKDLVEGKCEIPNWILTDKDPFSVRVTCGNTIGTKWTQITIDESGIIMPETLEEEPPINMEYVKTQSGENAAPYLRAGTNGLEYSQNGEDWNSGVSGVPEVPNRPKDAIYGRKNGDWVRIDELLNDSGDANVIEEIKVNDTALLITDKSVNIDLSNYAKKSDVEALKTLEGTASQLTDLDYSETDTGTIVTKINEIIGLLQARGIATV